MEEKKENPEARFFSSFEEEEKYRLQQVLKIPPVERIRQTVELILRAYGVTRQQLNERKDDNTIKLRYYHE
jgi:CRISPR-associated endonuclease Csn1